MAQELKAGTIGWVDLTVADAGELRDFYRDVAGWTPEPVEMEGYSDWAMRPSAGGDPVAGICHKRGSNAALPPVWLMYVVMENLDPSIARCRELGGRVLAEPRASGAQGRYAVIEDPAGAACALYQP
jgi:uncharacterized protein